MFDIVKIKKHILDLAIMGELINYNNGEKDESEVIDLFNLPKGWRWEKLGDVESIARGGSPRPIKSYITNDKNGINWIKIGDVDKNGKYIEQSNEKIIQDGVKHSRMVYPGDFLLTNSMSFGRPYITNIKGCIHDGWLVIHNNDDIIDRNYLYCYLSSNFAYNQFCNKVSGSTVDNLNIDRVKDSYIAIPPLEEQSLIVKKVDEIFEILDRIDELQKKYNYDKIVLESKIIEAGVSGELTEQLESDGDASLFLKQKGIENDNYDELPNNWTTVRLTSVCDICTGTSINEEVKKEKYYGLNQGYPYIATKDVGFDKIINYDNGVRIPYNEQNFKIAKNGSILLCIEGGSAGKKIGIVNQDVCFGNKLCKFYTDLIDRKFLFYYLQSSTFISNFKDNITGLIDGVSIGMIRKMIIKIPPLLEQKRIVERIENILSCI